MVLKYLHSKEKELAKFGKVDDRRVAMSSCNSRMNNIRNNMCKAMTSIPGSFTFQGMLVLDCKLNGRQVYGLVDTGAQASLLSEKCAIRCGLADLIDRQWEGKAKGLEEQRICGRIHMVDLIVGETKLPTSFAVLPTQAMDVIIGIDTLKIYECAIDLDKGILRIGKKKTSIKFLKEEELPVELGKREARCLKCRKSYQQLTSPFQFRSAEKNQLNHQRKEVRCPEMS
ncbi:hypothetical protein O3M35_013179 [Rhynocoris fuscipes]|uniref:Aspartic peptidase DDI1-type domain-containing protein n=1 Tax=Rhynocoris fuscipes TaxID=488301 RepID=A0AAW1CEQ7_9HEMI